jgi:hypothetical protein
VFALDRGAKKISPKKRAGLKKFRSSFGVTANRFKWVRGVRVACVMFLAFASMRAADTANHENPKVRLVSTHVGLMFAPDEKLDVGLQLEGSLKATTLDYTLEQLGGEWRSQGKIKTPAVPRGETKVEPLPLSLPEPGLYRLHLQGSLGGKFSMDRNIAILSRSPATEANSPWGIFYVPPSWFGGKNPQAAKDEARSIRALGASWVRLGFWDSSFGDVSVTPAGPDGRREVRLNMTDWKDYARELRAEKIFVMGNLGIMPRALSSQPKNEQVLGDGGPGYGRVRPADYGLWEQFIEQVARTLKDDVVMWEIGNEPDNQGVYWLGTPEELAEFVHHTSLALRRVNPSAKIATAGFTNDRRAHGWMARMIELGVAKDIDVFTIHYTDREAVSIDRWREIMRIKNVDLPLWNTEEVSAVPLFNLEHGISHSFKFLHVAIGYDESAPLVEKDYTVRPTGMEFAMGVRCLGSARYLRSRIIPGGVLHLFQRDQEIVGVVQRDPLSVYLDAPRAMELSLLGEALDPSRPITMTTALGRISKVIPGESNRLHVTLREPLVFINGCGKLDAAAPDGPPPSYVLSEAENAKTVGPWENIERRDASGQRVLELWNAEMGPGKTYSVDFSLNVPGDGSYDVLLAGGSLSGLKSPRTVSPFSWSLDGQTPVRVDNPPPLAPGAEQVQNGLNQLGSVQLQKGQHVFIIVINFPWEP